MARNGRMPIPRLWYVSAHRCCELAPSSDTLKALAVFVLIGCGRRPRLPAARPSTTAGYRGWSVTAGLPPPRGPVASTGSRRLRCRPGLLHPAHRPPPLEASPHDPGGDKPRILGLQPRIDRRPFRIHRDPAILIGHNQPFRFFTASRERIPRHRVPTRVWGLNPGSPWLTSAIVQK